MYYRYNKNLFYCYSMYLATYIAKLLYLFYAKGLFTNQFMFHFRTEDSDTHMYAHSWSSHDGGRNQQKKQLLSLSLSLSVSVCLSVCLFLCLSVSQSLSLDGGPNSSNYAQNSVFK